MLDNGNHNSVTGYALTKRKNSFDATYGAAIYFEDTMHRVSHPHISTFSHLHISTFFISHLLNKTSSHLLYFQRLKNLCANFCRLRRR